MHLSEWSTLYYCCFAKLRTLMTIQLDNNQMPFCRQRKFCSKLLVIWFWQSIVSLIFKDGYKTVNSSLSLIAGSFHALDNYFSFIFVTNISGRFKIVLQNDVSRVKVTK